MPSTAKTMKETIMTLKTGPTELDTVVSIIRRPGERVRSLSGRNARRPRKMRRIRKLANSSDDVLSRGMRK